MYGEDNRALYDHLADLGRMYDDLMDSLRFCVDLLNGFKHVAPDPQEWQEILDRLEKKIMAGERLTRER